MASLTDTIAAIATPIGQGGVGIIRVSGPGANSISSIICEKDIPAHQTIFSKFKDQQQIIDEGLVLYFPKPRSFTGEDVIEFHCHGSPIILDRLLQKIISLGARLAEPGEFSKRAFLNNKIDLVQAEAIADLIASGSYQAAQAAINSLQGVFSKKINELVNELIHLRMYLEAELDFSDEEINFLSTEKIKISINKLVENLESILKNANQGRLLREGLSATIIGKPNAGKSSLLNLLVGQESAIVTDIPGTTRDILREYIQIDGIPLHIVDTAGLRHSVDRIEQEGIKRAKQELEKTDLIMLVFSGDEESFSDNLLKLEDLDLTQLNKPILIIFNKIDLTKHQPKISTYEKYTVIYMSAKTGDGLSLLREQIKLLIGHHSQEEGVYTARRRHIDALLKTKDVLKNLLVSEKILPSELLAEEFREAQKFLSEITGEFTSDDLLGKIFSSFCIGK